jgi:UDP-4-amino-4-deoxy-L-arabinose formyltransferase / UDP-glucuronic acid dehydrogenase (UDP-4-keto-hexauronic acid decarboxylating)
MKILILGSDGFIGYHLTSSILQDSRFDDVSIVGVDLYKTRTNMIPEDSRFTFHQGDIIKDRDLVDKLINECDVVLPFVAIATPKLYVEKPLTVFELDFEENLRIIKLAHKLDKRVIFPSTSEVYGKGEIPFDEEKTDLVYGPIKYSRWIYACSKQLLDRVIFAMNQKDKFRFTLFRPFNWEGPYLDSLQASESGSSRLITQLIDDAIYKNHVTLVDGGNQKRCFTDVRDGVEALKLILLNEEKSNGQIFNVGNPLNNLSVKEVATQLVDKLKQRNLTTEVAEIRVQPSSEFYGEGYEDVSTRVPSIENLRNTLGWNPMYSFEESLETILDTIVIQK